MENILTIKEKILAFLQAMNIKKVDYFEATGIQSSNFKGKNMASQPGGDMLVKTLTRYPQLSAEWLMRGEGNMFKSDKDVPESTISQSVNKPLIKNTVEEESSVGIVSQFLVALSDKDNTIRTQAEEIGRLRERIKQLEQEHRGGASDALDGATANVG